MYMCVHNYLLSVCCFFFFKQKTAYEMRISDWSSDVRSSDLRLDVAALLDELLHRTELVEWVQRLAMDILGQRIFLSRHDVIVAHDAGHWLRLGHATLLHELLQRPKAAPSGRDFEAPRLVAFFVALRPHRQALEQAARKST